MKDYLSAQGGWTYQDPEMEDPLYIGLAITNKANRARRLGIYTNSQFSHGSGEFFGDADHDVKLIDPTVGFTHGVEVGLTAKLDYHKVIDAEVVLPYTASSAFAGMGAAEFLRYSESSLVTARLNEQNSQLTASDVKDGQVYHLGEYLRNDHLHILSFFSLTIKHNGVSHHFGFDGLKHPALLTRDLNRQLANKIPGVIGFFTEKTEDNAGINLYLSVEEKVGEIQIPVETHSTIHYPSPTVAALPSFDQGMHLNAFLDADVTLSHTGMVKGTVIESAPPELSFASVTTTASELIENATKMKPTDSITSDEKYLIWETDIVASQFKNLEIDSRYSATVVQLTPPDSFPGKALSLAKVEYVIDGVATPADLVPCFRNLYKDGTSTPDFRKGVIFTDALHADNLGWNDKPGSMGMFGCFVFVDKSTRDHVIVETAGHTAEVKLSDGTPMPTYYIAVVAPPSVSADTSPFFRTPKDVKLRVTYFLYEEVEFMEPVVIDAEYDFINKRADLTYDHPVDYKHLMIMDRAYFILNGHYYNAFTPPYPDGGLTTSVQLDDGAIAEGEYPESFSVNFELTGLLSPYQKSGDYAVVKKPFTINYSVKYPNTDDEIPSNEMHFTTLAGSVKYVGAQGDQIVLSDGTIVDVTATNGQVTFNAPSGKHVVKLAESVVRNNYVSVGGEALVELHNFPTLSTVTKFNFWPFSYSPNLVKVPTILPNNLTDLSYMFMNAQVFNQDISSWDVSNVTDMGAMFYNASAFNQDIGSWDVSKVTRMAYMFFGASAFNQPLNNWDVSNVTDMEGMFYIATSFNQDLSGWCVPLISSLPESFATNSALIADNFPVWGTCPRGENIPANEVHFVTNGAAYYQGIAGDEIVYSDGTTLPITSDQRVALKSITGTQKVVLKSDRGASSLGKVICFEGSGITELLNFPKSNEINGCKFYIASGSANLVKVPTTLPPNITDLSRMFQGCRSFNQDISGWDTTNVVNMSLMFYEAVSFNQPVGGWNISNVTDLSRVFQFAGKFNQDISAWNTANVTNMSNAFNGAALFNQPLTTWDTSNVTNMRGMFQSATNFNQPLNAWNVSNVTDMTYMFYEASAFNSAIDQWDTSKVTKMGNMFYNATSFNVDISSWNTASVDDMGYMFYGAKAFSYSLQDWCVPLIPREPSSFGNNNGTFGQVKYPTWGTCPRGENIAPDEMYFTTTNGPVGYVGIPGDVITLSDGTTYTVLEDGGYSNENVPAGKHKVVLADTREHGRVSIGGKALTELHNFPTMSTVTEFSFYPNTPSPNLVKVPTVLPSNLTVIKQMFYGATSFNQDISMWDTSNVTDFSQVFAGCNLFNQPLTGWNTSNGTNLRAMFDRCFVFNQPVSHFVTSNCTDFGYMFNACTVFNQDLSNFDTSKATKMDGMFRLAKLFNYPLNHFVTTDVTTFDKMFASAFAFNQPLDTWDTSNATNMDSMFSNASKFNQDISSWNVKGVTNMDSMFYYAKAFTGNLSQWCVTNITSTPANFATSAAAFTKPVWGTCPRGEN